MLGGGTTKPTNNVWNNPAVYEVLDAQAKPAAVPMTDAQKTAAGPYGYKLASTYKAPTSNTTTNKTTTTNAAAGDGFSMAYYPGWDEAAARADWKATNGAKGQQASGGGESMSISDLYEPYKAELDRIYNDINVRGTEQLSGVDTQYGQGKDVIASEGADLEKSLAQQETNLNTASQSGYEDALRSYNALKQQGLSRYGQGSSAGQAIGELVGQQFLRSTGEARNLTEQGRQQIGQELAKVNTYIKGKIFDLDNWKREATRSINENLSAKLSEINFRKADVEANKMADRQAALKEAMDSAKATQAADMQYKRDLANAAVQSLQAATNRALTPAEIAKTVNDMMAQTIQGFTGQTLGTSANPAKNTSVLTYKTPQATDEYGNLINPSI
jgi:hypothetical protein